MSQPADAMPERAARPWWRWLMLAIGPVVLVALFTMIGVDEIWGALRSARPVNVAVALALALPALLIRTARWKLLLARDGDGMTYGEVTAIFAYAVFVGTATPGRIGEFFKIVHLKQRGIAVGRALASVLLDRLLDVAMLLVLAAGGIALVAGGQDLPVALLALAGFVVVVWSARSLACGTLGRGVARVLRPITPAALATKLAQLREGLCEALDELPRSSLAAAAGLTALGWAVNYLANWQMAVALGLPLSYVDIAGVSAVASLVGLLPISVMGAGTRDVAMVAVLATYGVARPEAIALSTMFLVFMIWNALVCGVSAFSRHVRASATPRGGHTGAPGA